MTDRRDLEERLGELAERAPVDPESPEEAALAAAVAGDVHIEIPPTDGEGRVDVEALREAGDAPEDYVLLGAGSTFCWSVPAEYVSDELAGVLPVDLGPSVSIDFTRASGGEATEL